MDALGCKCIEMISTRLMNAATRSIESCLRSYNINCKQLIVNGISSVCSAGEHVINFSKMP